MAIFLEILLALYLLGVLAAHGWLYRDTWFSLYLAVFAAGTGYLWVLAQEIWARPVYAYCYAGIYGLTFVIGAIVLFRSSVNFTLFLALCVAFALVPAVAGGSWVRQAEGTFAAVALAFGAAAFAAKGADAFEVIKFSGLGWFWLLQAAACALYWWFGNVIPRWADLMTAVAGLAGAACFGLMAYWFSGLGLEGAPQGTQAAIREGAFLLGTVARRSGE